MRDVDPIHCRQFLGELDDFVGLAPSPWLVLETGGEADGAFAKPLPDELAHPRDFVRARRPSHIVTHHTPSNGAVADQQHGVRPDAQLADERALLRNRPRRAPVLVDDDGRDALRHQVGGRASPRILVAESAMRTRPIVCMRVDIDEAGGNVFPKASMTRAAVASFKTPTTTMRPFRTPTSAGNQGLPVPSSTRPLRMSRS